MPDEQVKTFGQTLYDKYRRDLKWNIVFGAVSSAILLILALIIILNRFVLIKVYVSGSSMKPTLFTGDIVILNTRAQPEHGDVIVISGEENYWLIKRAIAFGGDTVKIKDGVVSLKKAGETAFTKLTEPYLDAQVKTVWDDPRADGFLVPEGQIFYLGDNRKHSKDSRSEFGTCKTEQVVGVVGDFSMKIKGVTTFINNFSVNIIKLFKGKTP